MLRTRTLFSKLHLLRFSRRMLIWLPLHKRWIPFEWFVTRVLLGAKKLLFPMTMCEKLFKNAEIVRTLMMKRNVYQTKYQTIRWPRNWSEMVSTLRWLSWSLKDILFRSLGITRRRYSATKITFDEMKKQWNKELILTNKSSMITFCSV